MKKIILIALLALTSSVYAQGEQLDLPMVPPRFNGLGQTTLPTPIEPDDDDADDPSDVPPPTFYGEEIDTENDTIIYVIDRSGSMGLDLQISVLPNGNLALSSRMERAKTELIRSVSALSDNFKFNIISYDCGIIKFAQGLVAATEETKKAAVAWINGLFPGGATATGPATSVALSLKENRAVVLLTDGAPNCGSNSIAGHRSMIQNSNTSRAVINVFGVSATGAYRAFCQGVASDSGGNYFDVP